MSTYIVEQFLVKTVFGNIIQTGIKTRPPHNNLYVKAKERGYMMIGVAINCQLEGAKRVYDN